MNTGTITTIIVAIIGIVGGGGIWAYISTRHRPPIERAEAETARESAQVSNALAVAESALKASVRQDTIVERLDAQVEDLRRSNKNLKEEMSSLRDENKRLDGRVDVLHQENNSLRASVDALGEESHGWRVRYHSALEYIRRVVDWATGHTTSTTKALPDLPSLIAEDLSPGTRRGVT